LEAREMIVIGVDVHKQSVTAVVIDEAGRPLDEKTVPVGSDELIGWASAHGDERLWAVEDCRTLTGWLERQLLGLGEQLVRVPPKLTVPERRARRARGKSDPIDGLAIARAALREPDLPRPRAGERVYVEIKLLVDHRDDLVDECRRAQQRLRWHLFQLDPAFAVPLRLLARPSHLEHWDYGSRAASPSTAATTRRCSKRTHFASVLGTSRSVRSRALSTFSSAPRTSCRSSAT
jgi:transposase